MLLLQPSSLRHPKPSLSSAISSSFPLQNPHYALPPTPPFSRLRISCSFSKVHSYGTVDYERRPMVKWNSVYKRISLMENPEFGAAFVLNQMEKDGKKLTKWELCRVVKELRKYRRHRQALEVYDWMNNKEERFRLSASDAAIQLDLIAKVRGLSSAEDYFMRIPDTIKDRRVYGALLNAYVRAKITEKAESLFDKMRSKDYCTHALPFNVMMTMYMNLRQYDKVDALTSEMIHKNVRLDIYSYNIWLSSCGARASAEQMEEVFEKMKLDKSINPNWTTFSTMATMYIKMGLLEKAEDSLRRVESRITGRDRIPYHYLLSLYGSIGNEQEVYRVWNIYKSVFPTIPNLGYHAIISSLVRMNDIKGAEKIYEEWLPVKTSYDPRIANLLMAWYVRNGNLDKAENLFDQMTEMGGEPNSNTWEILADGHVKEKRISEAVNCFKEALIAQGSKSWKPKPSIVASFYKLCEEEGDMESKRVLEDYLTRCGYLEDKNYASLIRSFSIENEASTDKDRNDERSDSEENEMFLNQLQENM